MQVTIEFNQSAAKEQTVHELWLIDMMEARSLRATGECSISVEDAETLATELLRSAERNGQTARGKNGARKAGHIIRARIARAVSDADIATAQTNKQQ